MIFIPGSLYKLKKNTIFDVVGAFKIKDIQAESILTFLEEEKSKSIEYRGFIIIRPIFIYDGIKIRLLQEFLESKDELLEDCFELVTEVE